MNIRKEISNIELFSILDEIQNSIFKRSYEFDISFYPLPLIQSPINKKGVWTLSILPFIFM